MPFNKAALEELFEIVGTSQNLVDVLSEFGGPQNRRSIKLWRNTDNGPSVKYIDAMYAYAASIERYDLKFYLPPKSEDYKC